MHDPPGAGRSRKAPARSGIIRIGTGIAGMDISLRLAPTLASAGPGLHDRPVQEDDRPVQDAAK